MPGAAHNSTVEISGVKTAFEDEATTDAGDHKTYQITSTTKRQWSPDDAVAVEVDEVAASAEDYTVDYLFGKVTFLEAQDAEAVVTVSGQYLPMLPIATARQCEMEFTGDELDTTTFHATDSCRKRIVGMQDVRGSLEGIEALLDDHDPAGDPGDPPMLRLIDLLLERTPKLVRFRPGNSGDYFCAWVLFGSESVRGSVADLVNSGVDFVGAARPGAAFGIGT